MCQGSGGRARPQDGGAGEKGGWGGGAGSQKTGAAHMKNMEGLVAFARLALVQRAPQQTQRGAARICSRIHQRIPLSQQPQRGAAVGAALKEGRGAGPKREGKQEEQLNAPEGGGGGG